MRYVEDPDVPISRIAWLLGFEDVSSFSHAFKRWTGVAPADARCGCGSSPGLSLVLSTGIWTDIHQGGVRIQHLGVVEQDDRVSRRYLDVR